MERVLPFGKLEKALRYAFATALILVSGSGLDGAFLGTEVTVSGRVARLAVGLGFPWVAAWLVPASREYRARLLRSYLWTLCAAIFSYFIVPALLMVLLDSGVI